MADPNELVMPAPLRAAIAADLRAVHPLPPPAVRAAWLAPIAVILLGAAAIVFGIRPDARRLGWMLTWGASSLETLLALALVIVALREAVPGTTLSRRALMAAFAGAIGAAAAITWLTWSTSPIRLGRDPGAFVWRVCFGATLASAMPPLAVCAALVARAFPLRPAVAGALYGLASGLMADAGWRIFCHFSDPAHVFGAHIAAVAVTTILGAFTAHALSRSSARFRRVP